jgi:hypothetical protein
MELQVPPLPFGEAADICGSPRVDTHSFEGRPVRHRRDHQPAGILKADEAAIRQMIDAGRQEQSVFTVEAFFVG